MEARQDRLAQGRVAGQPRRRRLRQPVVWVATVAGIAVTGPHGRRAAVRGVTCSAAASLIHLPIKRLFRRPRPRGAGIRAVGPLTTSFPSGHTAADLSFMFGAAQELPGLLLPLSIGTLGSHWSLLRGRKHYASDIVAGGAIALWCLALRVRSRRS